MIKNDPDAKPTPFIGDESSPYIARFLVEAHRGGTTTAIVRSNGAVEQHFIKPHHSVILELRPGDEFRVLAGYAEVTALVGGVQFNGRTH